MHWHGSDAVIIKHSSGTYSFAYGNWPECLSGSATRLSAAVLGLRYTTIGLYVSHGKLSGHIPRWYQ